MDLATATAQPIPITLAGKEWLVKPRTLQELGELQAWFKREIPSPLVRTLAALDQAKRLDVPLAPALRDAALEVASSAELSWPPRVGSWHWRDAVDQAGKVGHVVAFALQPMHPRVTDADGDRLASEALPDEVPTLACVLFNGRLPDPKELAPLTTGPTPTSDPSPSETTGPF